MPVCVGRHNNASLCVGGDTSMPVCVGSHDNASMCGDVWGDTIGSCFLYVRGDTTGLLDTGLGKLWSGFGFVRALRGDSE